jgi:uncharacterized membrane protein
MSTFVVSIFSNEAKAYEAVHAFEQLHMEGTISVYETTVVQRGPDGGLVTKQPGDGGFATTGIGMLVGGLLGILGGPVGIAVGAVAGTTLGATAALVKGDVSEEFLEDIAKTMKPGDYAVLAEVSETWTAPIDTRIQALGGTVLRERRSDYTDAMIAKRTEAFSNEIRDRKAERASRKAERMEGKLDDHIGEARERLQRVAGRAHDRLDSIKADLEKKLGALEEQAKKAKPEVKKEIEQHIVDVRKDFTERERKLSQAFELAQQALQ